MATGAAIPPAAAGDVSNPVGIGTVPPGMGTLRLGMGEGAGNPPIPGIIGGLIAGIGRLGFKAGTGDTPDTPVIGGNDMPAIEILDIGGKLGKGKFGNDVGIGKLELRRGLAAPDTPGIPGSPGIGGIAPGEAPVAGGITGIVGLPACIAGFKDRFAMFCDKCAGDAPGVVLSETSEKPSPPALVGSGGAWPAAGIGPAGGNPCVGVRTACAGILCKYP